MKPVKKALHKDFWMEIKKNKARFISIFCIVALGVAFFSGIQASSPDMRMSGDAYYTQTKLMDLKVMELWDLQTVTWKPCGTQREWKPPKVLIPQMCSAETKNPGRFFI